MAQGLVSNLTQLGDIIVDPFVGAGTVAPRSGCKRSIHFCWRLEPLRCPALLRGSYSHRIPTRRPWGISRQHGALSRRLVGEQYLRSTPSWVRRFFTPETLRNALAFRDVCYRRNEDFLLSCLLGILHHERPGFLSYPSSHLVPYLRDRNPARATSIPRSTKRGMSEQECFPSAKERSRECPSDLNSQKKASGVSLMAQIFLRW